MNQPTPTRRWIIWSLAVLFYFYEYFLRVAPGVMIQGIESDFHIGAGVFGTLTAFYLYAYAPMQLPVGILMDNYGARKLLTLATLACGLSGFFFGFIHHIWLADILRFITGAGSAFGFIGMVYICSHWFSRKILAFLVGAGNSIGMLGAVFGQGPMSIMVQKLSWRPSMIIVGAFGIILATIIFFAIRSEPKAMKKASHLKKNETKNFLKNLKAVCSNFQTWINGIIALLFYAGTVGFAGLWAIPFLKKVHHLSNEAASFATSMIFIGWIIAGPIVGYVSDKLCNRKSMLLIFTLFSLVFFLILLYVQPLSEFWIFVVMLLLGIGLAGELLCYTLAIELNPPEYKGTALALTNFLVFLGGSFFQTLIGWLLDYNWSGSLANGARDYSVSDYQSALICFPITLILAFFLSFFVKEKQKIWCQ